MKLDKNDIDSLVKNVLESATEGGKGIPTKKALEANGTDVAFVLPLKAAILRGEVPGYTIVHGRGGGIMRVADAAQRKLGNKPVAEALATAEKKLEKLQEKITKLREAVSVD